MKKQVWLVYYKVRTGKSCIPYDDSVGEALCFGWIDGIIKRIDDEKFGRKFMPRRKNSRWSESNRKRAKKMIREGRMTREQAMGMIEKYEGRKPDNMAAFCADIGMTEEEFAGSYELRS